MILIVVANAIILIWWLFFIASLVLRSFLSTFPWSLVTTVEICIASFASGRQARCQILLSARGIYIASADLPIIHVGARIAFGVDERAIINYYIFNDWLIFAQHGIRFILDSRYVWIDRCVPMGILGIRSHGLRRLIVPHQGILVHGGLILSKWGHIFNWAQFALQFRPLGGQGLPDFAVVGPWNAQPFGEVGSLRSRTLAQLQLCSLFGKLLWFTLLLRLPPLQFHFLKSLSWFILLLRQLSVDLRGRWIRLIERFHMLRNLITVILFRLRTQKCGFSP